jgi:hypothetical protein
VGSEVRTIGSLQVSNYLMVVINLCMVHKLWLMHHNFCLFCLLNTSFVTEDVFCLVKFDISEVRK